MQCRLGYLRADPDDHPWQFPGISRALRYLLLWALPSPRKILLILDDEIEKGRLRHRRLVLVKLGLTRKNNIRKTMILAAVV